MNESDMYGKKIYFSFNGYENVCKYEGGADG